MPLQLHLGADHDTLARWAGVAADCVPNFPIVTETSLPDKNPVLRLGINTHVRRLVPMHMGLVPSYAHDMRFGLDRVEAHAELLTCSSSFRGAFRRRRCLIPAASFVATPEETAATDPPQNGNPPHTGTSGEQPCSFALRTGDIFALAGVWENWTDDTGVSHQTFAIINVHPNPLLNPLIDRIPIVIQPADQSRWLGEGTNPEENPPLDLLHPLTAVELKAWRIVPVFDDVCC